MWGRYTFYIFTIVYLKHFIAILNKENHLKTKKLWNIFLISFYFLTCVNKTYVTV